MGGDIAVEKFAFPDSVGADTFTLPDSVGAKDKFWREILMYMLGNCFLEYRVHNVQIEAAGRDCTFMHEPPKSNSLTNFNVRINK